MDRPRVVPPPKLVPWRRLRSETVAKYRIIDIVKVAFEDGAGKPRGEGFTIQCADWCNVVALTPDEQVVLVWQYRFGTDALSLEIPGGMIDPGESPEQAARRELQEETGYEADAFELLLMTEPNPAVQNNRCFTFLARGARKTQATGFDAQEELETTLLPAARIEALIDSGEVTHGIVQGALETFWRKHGAAVTRSSPGPRGVDACEALLVGLEEQQRAKVVDLARRLRPDLTPEDVRNPHDFPELDDHDWQYEDGVLTGMQTALTALRAMRRDMEPKS